MSLGLSKDEMLTHNRAYQSGNKLIKGEIEILGKSLPPKPGWWTRRKLKKAIGLFEKVLELNPKNDAALFFIAKIYQRFEEHSTCLTYLLRAHAVNPSQAVYPREASITAMRQGRGRDAIRFAEAAIRVKPDDAGLLDNLALALLISGNLEMARAKAQEAVAANKVDDISKNVFEVIDYIAREGISCPSSAAELDKIILEKDKRS